MADQVSAAIVEHLRNQDGRLFQDEKVLSLQTDTKAFVWTQLSSLMRTHSFQSSLKQAAQSYIDWDDATSEDLVRKVSAVRPSIVDDLSYVVEAYQTLLKRSNFRVIVTETQVAGLLRGLFKRLIAQDCFVSKALLEQDPIKIDFLFREAFRLTLLHDCTILVSERHESSSAVAPEEPEEAPKEEAQVTLNEESSQPKEVQHQEDQEDKEADNQVAILDDKHESASTVGDEPPSELKARDDASIVSRAMSALSQASNHIRKPRVRTIIFDDERSNYSRK